VLADDGDDGLVRLRLDLAYDGAEFSGWAAQPSLRTVQGVLAEGLGRALRLAAPPQLTVAGRTDAGVHARGQVVHADIPAATLAPGDNVPQSPEEWQPGCAVTLRRLSRALPPDVRVRQVSVAPEGFNARFSALWRRYSYRVCDDPALADPLRRRDTLWHSHPLDLAAMNEAAALLTGEHDFAAFCRKREGATTIRALRLLDWQRDADGVPTARVVADAFCHNMVRSLVGALLPVGDGSRPVTWPAQVLATETRHAGVRVAPAHGLCLEEVRYPPAAELAAREAQTRRVRELP
jgi:tRNA pseudouridine38-40 synthase